jgi:hypothetical protein
VAQITENYQFKSLDMGDFLELPADTDFSHSFYHHVLAIAWHNEAIESLPVAVTEAGLELPNHHLPGLLQFLFELDEKNGLEDDEDNRIVDYKIDSTSMVVLENGNVQATVYSLDDFRYDLSEEDTMPNRIAEEISLELGSLFDSYPFDQHYALLHGAVSVLDIMDCVFAARQEAALNRQTETLF